LSSAIIKSNYYAAVIDHQEMTEKVSISQLQLAIGEIKKCCYGGSKWLMGGRQEKNVDPIPWNHVE